jgi:hypothetical protein
MDPLSKALDFQTLELGTSGHSLLIHAQFHSKWGCLFFLGPLEAIKNAHGTSERSFGVGPMDNSNTKTRIYQDIRYMPSDTTLKIRYSKIG